LTFYRDYPLQLIDAAEEMIAQSHYEISVVTSQMACEISVERTLAHYFRAQELKHLEGPIDDLLPSYNLANEKVRKLYTAVTGDKIQTEFFWTEYKIMVTIRNKAIHAGQRIEKSQAEMVLRVAKLILKHLAKVSERCTATSIGKPSVLQQ
jgi:hypothetical protein